MCNVQPIADKQTTIRAANFLTSTKLQKYEKPERTTTETSGKRFKCRKKGKNILENTKAYIKLSVFQCGFARAVM